MAARRRPRQPNNRLRQARMRMPSPSGSGQPMSRQELADAVNRYLADKQDPDGPVTANHVGKLEQGLYTWPRALRRQAYRAILGASTDAELGFFNEPFSNLLGLVRRRAAGRCACRGRHGEGLPVRQ